MRQAFFVKIYACDQAVRPSAFKTPDFPVVFLAFNPCHQVGQSRAVSWVWPFGRLGVFRGPILAS